MHSLDSLPSRDDLSQVNKGKWNVESVMARVRWLRRRADRCSGICFQSSAVTCAQRESAVWGRAQQDARTPTLRINESMARWQPVLGFLENILKCQPSVFVLQQYQYKSLLTAKWTYWPKWGFYWLESALSLHRNGYDQPCLLFTLYCRNAFSTLDCILYCPTPKLSPHRKLSALLDFRKTSFCVIY